jgi:4-aminobutyrate aminotransferase
LAQGLLRGRHRPRDEPLLLPLPARQDLPLLRGRLREGHRGCHPVLHLRRHRRHDRRAHPGRRRIAEPIQGVGGFITPPKEYFKIAFSIVKQYGGDFIADEVQTGLGRTGGKWFGIEHWEVEPDILTSAKSLGNGYPIGLTVATPEVANAFQGPTISTFGGNPIASVTASAVIDLIEADDLRTNCTLTGAYLRERLTELQQRFPIIGDVRGMGLMQALELVVDPATKEPAPALATEVLEAARDRGLLIGKGGMYNNVLRLSPPMNIGKADVDEAIRILEETFAAVTAALCTTA